MKILVVGLQKDGHVVPATYELLTAATCLNGDLSSVILAENADTPASELASRGGGKVLTVSHPNLKHFNDELYTNVLTELINKHQFDIVLGPASFYGKALFSRLAGKLDAPLASDITALRVDGDNVVASRPHYGGAVISELIAKKGPYLLTVRPKIFAEQKDGSGEVVAETIEAVTFDVKMSIDEVKSESTGSINLTEADIIVAAGRGMKAEEHLPLVHDLASALGAAFGASRAIVDAGWTPYSNQVGQTGKTVNPKLYIAVGISGAIQHLVGMRGSGTIVAVNKDKDAPIFNVANYGIIGDAFEIVPALTAKFKAELG